MSEIKGQFLFQKQFEIRWGDMDALGHVNNRIYFQYFEQLRLEWYEQAGFPPLGTSPEGMVIVDNYAQYLKPIVYPAIITGKLFGHSPGRSSFVSEYGLYIDDELHTVGRAKIVCVNNERGKSIPLPDSLRSMLVNQE